MRQFVLAGVAVLLLLVVTEPPSLAFAAEGRSQSSAGARLHAAGQPLQIAVPYVSQRTPVPGLGRRVADYACGPASAAMIGAFWAGAAPALGRAEYLMGGTQLVGIGSEPWQVAQAIRALNPGIEADAAAANGRAAAFNLLTEQLSLGRPIVALVHPTWFSTAINHFVVVTGLDSMRGVVTFHDPLAGKDVTAPEAVFLAAWATPRHGRSYSYVWAAGNAATRHAAPPQELAIYESPLIQPVASRSLPVQLTAAGGSFDAGERVRVLSAGLRVHDAPEASARVVDYLAQGDPARVIAQDGGWVRLTVDGKTAGWVDSAFLGQ